MTRNSSIQERPTAGDLALTELVHRSLRAVGIAGRFGERKVFIVALWHEMFRVDAATALRFTGGEFAVFKRWLVNARRLVSMRARTPLVVLARADLVSAMDALLVADSETLTDGACFHFVLDPAAAPEAYAPHAPARGASATAMRGKVDRS